VWKERGGREEEVREEVRKKSSSSPLSSSIEDESERCGRARELLSGSHTATSTFRAFSVDSTAVDTQGTSNQQPPRKEIAFVAGRRAAARRAKRGQIAF
jgi:hypothetical protein